MSELISGLEALNKKESGESVEWSLHGLTWSELTDSEMMSWQVERFLNKCLGYRFRLKPKTISINGIEVPAPFEPKEDARVWFICDDNELGYAKSESYGVDIKSFYGWWRTEDEIKQVVSALKTIFKTK